MKRYLTVLAMLALAAPLGAQTATARGWIGVMQRPVAEGEGVVIDEVLENSPASRAGLQAGDTLVLWNGRRDVAAAIRERVLAPGDTVRLRVRRGGERDREVAVVAGRQPPVVAFGRTVQPREDVVIVRPGQIVREFGLRADSLALRADSLHGRLRIFLEDSLGPRLREMMPELERQTREIEEIFRRDFPSDLRVFDLGQRGVAGAEFAPLNEGLSSYFGTDEGVLVLTVAPETPAARAGLLAGDVVVRVDGTAVDDVAELRTLVARAQARATRRVEIEVLRRGQSRELEMRWE